MSFHGKEYIFRARSTVIKPPTYRRRITERSHDNNAINQHFVYITSNFVYSVGFQ